MAKITGLNAWPWINSQTISNRKTLLSCRSNMQWR